MTAEEQSRRVHSEQAADPARLLDYAPDFLACRDVQHTWPPRTDWSWRRVTSDSGRVTGYSRTMMCARCHTIARDVIDARTGQSRRSYTYPAGYSMPAGQGVTKREVRLEQLRRVVEELDAAEE